jgi:hypothetical protein
MIYFRGFIYATSVSLCSSGNIGAIGGPRDGSDIGAVWVFD